MFASNSKHDDKGLHSPVKVHISYYALSTIINYDSENAACTVNFMKQSALHFLINFIIIQILNQQRKLDTQVFHGQHKKISQYVTMLPILSQVKKIFHTKNSLKYFPPPK